MKVPIFVVTIILAAAASARAGAPGYVQCGTYDSYLLLYRSVDKFEELGKLRCGEKVEILGHASGYYQVRVEDGRVGWVLDTDISTTPPPPHHTFTFGMTESPKPVPVVAKRQAPSGALTNDDVIATHGNATSIAALLDRMKTTPCDFDTSPIAIRRLHSANIPDRLILAMLTSPVVSSAASADAASTVALTIPRDTGLDFHITRDIPAEGLLDGAVIELTADEDLVVHGELIVQKGGIARARALAVRPASSVAHPGEVAWFMQDVATVEGASLPAIFSTKQPGKFHAKMLDGYPYFVSEFDKGEPAIRALHSRIRVEVIPGSILQIPQAPSGNAAPLQAKVQAPPATSEKPAAALLPVASPASSAPDAPAAPAAAPKPEAAAAAPTPAPSLAPATPPHTASDPPSPPPSSAGGGTQPDDQSFVDPESRY